MRIIHQRFEWDSGHRVLGHEGRCAALHGHRYVAELYVGAAELDMLGRVIDFGEIKKLVGNWINEYWDHNMMLNVKDPLAVAFAHGDVLISHFTQIRLKDIFGNKTPYLMKEGNPTAENIAQELFEKASGLLNSPGQLRVMSVKVWETPNCGAVYNAPPLLSEQLMIGPEVPTLPHRY